MTSLRPFSSPFKAGKRMGFRGAPHPHPNPPLEGEGARHHRFLLIALLLAVMVLLAQIAALAHGVSHGLEPAHEPACEQCLGFAPLGAGLIHIPATWVAPEIPLPEALPAPVAHRPSFTRTTRNRDPPRV